MQALIETLRAKWTATMALASMALFSFDTLADENRVADHLSPVPSYISSDGIYESLLRDAFKQKENVKVLSAMYVIPSIEVESMTGIRETRAGPEVFSLTAETPIRNLDKERLPKPEGNSFKATTESIKILTCSRPIKKEIADRVMGIWDTELLRVSHEDTARIVIDGTNFVFSSTIAGKGKVSGQYLSPHATPEFSI